MAKVFCRTCKLTFELEDERFKAQRDSGRIVAGHQLLGAVAVWIGQCDQCDRGRGVPSTDVRLQRELIDLCDGVRRMEADGVERRMAIAALVEQQVNAEETDPGFRAYLELGGKK